MIWRRCQSTDVGELQHFECTERPERPRPGRWQPHHPRMWEYEVQSSLRGLGAPMRLPHSLFCLEDDDGIAGLSHWVEEDGPGVVEVAEMAIARRHRGGDGDVARKLMQLTLDEITDRAIQSDLEEVSLLGWIWHENRASQRLASAAGFVQTGHGATGVQQWSARILIAGAGL